MQCRDEKGAVQRGKRCSIERNEVQYRDERGVQWITKKFLAYERIDI